MARLSHRPLAQRLVVVAAFITVSSCTAGAVDTAPGGDPPSTTSAASTSTLETVPDGRVSTTTRPASPAQDLEQERTNFKNRILEDGFVSDAEWESAILALVACLGEGGVRTVEYDTRPGGWSFAYAEAIPGSGVNVDSVYADCYSGYVQDVESIVLAQTELTPQEKERVRVAMVACIGSQGVELPDDADDTEMIDAAMQSSPRLYGECRAQVFTTLFP